MLKFSRLFTVSILSMASSARSQEVAGDWTGQLDSGYVVRLHLESTASGFAGHLTNPSGNETLLDQVTFDGKHLHFAIDKLDLSYDSVWDARAQSWNGNLRFHQVYPLALKRVTTADLAPVHHKRPQEEAIASQVEHHVDRDVRFHNLTARIQLAGTLSLPRGKGPFGAVVLIAGTGRNTRDEDVWGHKVFVVLADALNRKGIAVLRYDKRGVGGSKGNYDTATTADFVSDAAAAVRWLKMQGEIDSRHVGVLGHSEGGILAPAVAAKDKSVSFVVTIAGPTIRGDKLFVLQSATTAKLYGAPDDYIAKRKIFDEQLYAAIIAAPSDAVALERARAIVAQGVTEKLIDSNEADTLAQDATRPWERYFLAYDPAPTLKSLSIPVLAVNGSLDVQVPARENLAAAREALKSNPKATVIELPGTNHLLQDAKTGSPAEYNDIEETMSPAALAIIGDWVSVQAARP